MDRLPLLIVEDDPEIASALQRGLKLQGYDSVAESRADRALERLRGGRFAAAIVDVMLGDDSGIELVRTARAGGAVLPILMLSALAEVDDRAAGLEAGADDYIVKPFSFDELVARLKVQEKRTGRARPRPAVLAARTRTLKGPAREAVLTEREFELLALLAGRAGEPVPRGEIFDALWAAEGSSSENVVDVYVGYLRKKLHPVTDFSFEIKTIRQKGFCLQGIPPVPG